MQARIKQDARYPSLNFFSGAEFTKGEWRQVPAGFEDAALANEYLETREDAGPLSTVVDAAPDVHADAGTEIKTDFETTTSPQKLTAVGKAGKTGKAGRTTSRKAGK